MLVAAAVQWAERIMGRLIMCFRAEGQFTLAPPQYFLYFFPEPHGHGSFRPTLVLVVFVYTAQFARWTKNCVCFR